MEQLDISALVSAAQAGDRVAYGRLVRATQVMEYHELLGCGVYKNDVLRVLGGDPARHAAIDLGLGLDRWASLCYRIPDIRSLSTARV